MIPVACAPESSVDGKLVGVIVTVGPAVGTGVDVGGVGVTVTFAEGTGVADGTAVGVASGVAVADEVCVIWNLLSAIIPLFTLMAAAVRFESPVLLAMNVKLAMPFWSVNV